MRVTADNIGPVLERIAQVPASSLDTETTGLEEHDVPFALILADEKNEYYLDERNMPNFWGHPGLQEVLSNGKRTTFLQNAKFDMRMLGMRSHAIGGHAFDDAIAARICRNDIFGSKAYSLDGQARRLGLKKDDRVEQHIKANGLHETRRDFFGREYKVPRYDRVPLELMEEYACTDARLTYDLAMHYIGRFDSDDEKVMLNESKLTKVCFTMERLGLCLNVPATLRARHEEQEKLASSRRMYVELTGFEFVNSAKSVGPHLDGYELPLTEGGNPSLTDDVLEVIILEGSPRAKRVAECVRAIRRYEKRITTYYENYLNMMDKEGIVHPTMWQAGTRTGRFSYSEPNLQNIPKKEPVEDFAIRACFQPRPGHVFVSMDYSQMEYRMMAAYANEVTIIDQVMRGVDFHEATSLMFGVTRDRAKTLNFAILYGAGDAKLAWMLGISVDEARRLKLKYFMALPKVERLVDEVKRVGRARGFVKNWFGRKLYAEPNFVYALPNHLIQGGGADVVKVAMNRIAETFPDIKMVLQVHDQLIFDVHPDQYQALRQIKTIMEDAFPAMNGMRLAVDVTWSPTSLAERDMVKGFPDEVAN